MENTGYKKIHERKSVYFNVAEVLHFFPGLKHNLWCISIRTQCVLLWCFSSLDLTDLACVGHNRFHRSKMKNHFQTCVQNTF